MDDFFGHIQNLTGITKYSSSEVITPIKVVNDMVNLLPSEVFNSKTRFLDPAVKSGRFLVEIYNRLMKSPEITKDFPNESERSRYILHNQLYGFATSPVAATITRKQLYGDAAIQGNIVYESGYISKIKNNPSIIKEITKENFGDTMKFDVVIGNPPYQENTGGGARGATQLYPKFVKVGNELTSRFLSFVIPSRWFIDPRSESQLVRDIVLTENTSFIRDYTDASEVFNDVSIAGGVCYFLKDKQYHGDCTVENNKNKWKTNLSNEYFIRHKNVSNIHNRIISKPFEVLTKEKMNPFGLKRAEKGNIVRTTETEVEVFGSHGERGYVERREITKGADLIDLYNVITDYGSGGPNGAIRVGILRPGVICTLTYYMIRSFNNLVEAENCKKYLSTNFVRNLIAPTVCNATTTDKNFILVPNQDFTSNSDIDWSQSIDNIDEQLFNKYNLSEEEIAYIKQTIKPIE